MPSWTLYFRSLDLWDANRRVVRTTTMTSKWHCHFRAAHKARFNLTMTLTFRVIFAFSLATTVFHVADKLPQHHERGQDRDRSSGWQRGKNSGTTRRRRVVKLYENKKKNFPSLGRETLVSIFHFALFQFQNPTKNTTKSSVSARVWSKSHHHFLTLRHEHDKVDFLFWS